LALGKLFNVGMTWFKNSL